jgi:hypothetical protein
VVDLHCFIKMKKISILAAILATLSFLLFPILCGSNLFNNPSFEEEDALHTQYQNTRSTVWWEGDQSCIILNSNYTNPDNAWLWHFPLVPADKRCSPYGGVNGVAPSYCAYQALHFDYKDSYCNYNSSIDIQYNKTYKFSGYKGQIISEQFNQDSYFNVTIGSQMIVSNLLVLPQLPFNWTYFEYTFTANVSGPQTFQILLSSGWTADFDALSLELIDNGSPGPGGAAHSLVFSSFNNYFNRLCVLIALLLPYLA